MVMVGHCIDDADDNIVMTVQGILVKDEQSCVFSISFVSSNGFKQDPYNWRAAKVMLMCNGNYGLERIESDEINARSNHLFCRKAELVVGLL